MWCRFDGNEWLCNIRCVELNCYDLGLLQVGLKSFMISVDYRVYMGSSLETWLLVDCFYTWTLIIWSVLWQVHRQRPKVLNPRVLIPPVSNQPSCSQEKGPQKHQDSAETIEDNTIFSASSGAPDSSRLGRCTRADYRSTRSRHVIGHCS